MTCLLDTCIVSRLIKLDVRTDLEKCIRKCILSQCIDIRRIANEERYRMLLEDWLFGQVVPRFKNKILEITVPIAFTWGKISGQAKQQGNNIPVSDGLIAATAIHHGLIVVTENSKHFEHCGVEVINPWIAVS